MPRLRLIMIFCWGLVFVCRIDCADSAQIVQGSPVIVFPGQTFTQEFGYVNPEEHLVTIKRIQKSCSCVQLDIQKDHIEPKGSISAFAAITASRNTGKHQVRIICDLSDGVTEKQIMWTCDYTVADYLHIDAGPVLLQRQGKLFQGSVIAIRGAHPDKWRNVEANGKPNNLGYQVSMEQDAQSGEWSLRIVDERFHQEFGDFRDRIRLTFFDDQHTAMKHSQEIGLTVRKPGSWTAEPSQALVGLVPVGKSSAVSIKLHPQNGDSPTVIPNVIAVDAVRTTCALSDTEGGAKILTITFRGEGEPGPYSSEVIVEFNNGDRLHIPYAASVIK